MERLSAGAERIDGRDLVDHVVWFVNRRTRHSYVRDFRFFCFRSIESLSSFAAYTPKRAVPDARLLRNSEDSYLGRISGYILVRSSRLSKRPKEYLAMLSLLSTSLIIIRTPRATDSIIMGNGFSSGGSG